MRLLRGVFLNRIYRFGARMVCDVGKGGARSRLLPFRLPSRRSGCVPALPYPPLRYFQSGSHQPRRAMIFHRTATTPLTFFLTPGVHRIWACTPWRTPSDNGDSRSRGPGNPPARLVATKQKSNDRRGRNLRSPQEILFQLLRSWYVFSRNL